MLRTLAIVVFVLFKMNRHGLKLHLKEVNDELKKGIDKLGSTRFNKLKRRKIMYLNLLRYKHPNKKNATKSKK